LNQNHISLPFYFRKMATTMARLINEMSLLMLIVWWKTAMTWTVSWMLWKPSWEGLRKAMMWVRNVN